MLDFDLIFNVANLFVLPFWLLMILLPNWGVTRQVMQSFIPFALLASLYIAMFVVSLSGNDAAASFANPQLADIAQLFGDERIALTGWVHFLVMDLFVGRWMYLDGQDHKIWTIHSLALSLFAGPMGLLSHLITRTITLKVRSSQSAASLSEV
jgi:hypothetical protein